ncbi:MAG: tetratricopeptide repeat protein [Mesorhizobium sp.]|nr:MAG: tetratricopeptide repeat protein [Mesorhizobium sp.]
MRQRRTAEGFALLDEAMISVTAGELSPLLTGLIYCSVIEACQQVHDLGRAREWTSALGRWCAKQPQLISFSGTCLMHRAEIKRLSGAWQDAIDEAQQAVERLTRSNNRKDTAGAWYQLAEVHRLRGDFDAAEQAYRSASQIWLRTAAGPCPVAVGRKAHRCCCGHIPARHGGDDRPSEAHSAAACSRRDHVGG